MNFIMEKIGITDADMVKCPKCGLLTMYPPPHEAFNSISRDADETEVCPHCGIDEAL